MSQISPYRLGMFLCFFALLIIGPATINAQDAAKDDDSIPLVLPGKLEKPEDPAIYDVPKDATPEELMEFLGKLMSKDPKDRAKVAGVFLEIGDRILAASPSDDLAMNAAFIKLNGLVLLAREDAKEKAKIDEFIKELEKDPKFADVLDTAKAVLFQVSLTEIMEKDTITKEDFEAVKKDVFATADKEMNEDAVRKFFIFSQFCEIILDKVEDRNLVINALKEVVAKLNASEDEDIKELAKHIEKSLKRLDLVGNEMKIEGVNLKGEKFDWKSLRGKVVLVDFWATWCGPCIEEVPNMTKMYEKYKDKGFEIVGISLDSNVEALKSYVEKEKTPWIILSEAMGKEEKIDSVADFYGITGIPTMFLVDREGKVISTSARGDTLVQLLEKAFPEDKKEEDKK